jgi:tetratricopeptide (TPR) repeat protein
MEPIKKNRLKFESVEPLTNPEIDQFETDEYQTIPRTRTAPNPLPWILVFLLLVLLVSWALYYFIFNKDKGIATQNKQNDFSSRVSGTQRVIEKYYYPNTSLNLNLAKCANAYADGRKKEAEIKCSEFLEKNEPIEDKSIALTYMGIMQDESGKYELAIDSLKRAIQMDPKNRYAYYNLIIVYNHAGNVALAFETSKKAKELFPTDSEIIKIAGNVALENNDARSASEFYKEGLHFSPEDPNLTYNLALSQEKQGLIPEAIENYKKAILSAGRSQISEFANAHLGAIYYHRDEFNGAEHHFREALSIQPSNARYLYNLGIVLLKQKKSEQAVGVFQKAIDSGSSEPQIYRYIAESLNDLKQYDQAIQALEKALRIKPDDADSMFQLADLYYNKGNLGLSEDLFRKILKNSTSSTVSENAYINLGIILDDMERYSEALQYFEEALKLNNKNDNAYYNLGIALKNSGQPMKALEAWRRASSINSAEPKYRESIGDYYLENAYSVEAAKEFEELSKANPYNYKFRLKLADSYYKMKEFEQAEKNLLYVLNHSKSSEELKMAHRKLAVVYSEGGESKNKSQALESAYRGSHIDPDDMESKLVLAKVLMDSNSLIDREKAIDELTAIIRSDVKPKVAAKAYNYLGVCYFKNQEYKKAMSHFQNALDLDPNLSDAYDNKRAARAKYEDYIHSKKGNL